MSEDFVQQRQQEGVGDHHGVVDTAHVAEHVIHGAVVGKPGRPANPVVCEAVMKPQDRLT